MKSNIKALKFLFGKSDEKMSNKTNFEEVK